MELFCFCTVNNWIADRDNLKDFIVPTAAIFVAIWSAYGAAGYQLRNQQKIEKERSKQKMEKIREFVLIALKKERATLFEIKPELDKFTSIKTDAIPGLTKWDLQPNYYKSILNIGLTSLMDALGEPLKQVKNITDVATFICLLNDSCEYMARINAFQDSFLADYQMLISSLNTKQIDLLRSLRSATNHHKAPHFNSLRGALDSFESEMFDFERQGNDSLAKPDARISNIYIFRNLAQSVVVELSTNINQYPELYRVSQDVLWSVNVIEVEAARFSKNISEYCTRLYQSVSDSENVIKSLSNI